MAFQLTLVGVLVVAGIILFILGGVNLRRAWFSPEWFALGCWLAAWALLPR